MTARFRFSKNRQTKEWIFEFWQLKMSETFSMIFKHCADDATESEIKTDCNTVIPMVTKCLCKRQHFLGHLPTALFPVPVILLGHMEELLIHCLKEWKTKIYYHLEKWSRTWWKNPFHLHAVLDFAFFLSSCFAHLFLASAFSFDSMHFAGSSLPWSFWK